MTPGKADIIAASERIAAFIHRTPVTSCASLNSIFGADLFFKCENLQKAGAFKSRGAMNAVLQLNEAEAGRGVATHSSGNHAQALARAAKIRGIAAYIVMPENAAMVKVNAVRYYGGLITFCSPTLAAREASLEKVVAETGAEIIHPYNDLRIISGQATACKELLEDYPDLDMVVAPVGGGGLLAGTCISASIWGKGCEVVGAEPSAADDAQRSLKAGNIIPSLNPNTIADGLLTSLGTLTFPIIQKYVSDIITADESRIIEAMRLLWERAKLLVEPSAATALAILLARPDRFRGKKVGIILSGGNVDLDTLPWIKR